MRAFLALLLCIAALPLPAEPVRYALQASESVVGFDYIFGKEREEIQGRMPIAAADVIIDFDRVENSQIAVALDVSRADAGFLFGTQAMRGPSVLWADRFPRITFRSTAVRRQGEGARVTGDLTIRGVTRRVELNARLYRQRGTDPGDLDRLSILLTGSVSRNAFGAGGWPEWVADPIDLTILARIERAG